MYYPDLKDYIADIYYSCQEPTTLSHLNLAM